MKSSNCWPETNLGNHLDILTGFPFKSSGFTSDPCDVPLVKGENVHQGYIDWTNPKCWSINNIQPYEKYILKPNDVVLAMDRPWIEAGLKWSWIRSYDPLALLVQRVARLRGINGLDSVYLRYIIASPYFTDYIKPIVTGINVPHISSNQICAFRFTLPPLKTQYKITSILSNYDSLFDNNYRRIALLEKIVKIIYNQWFVKFKFPGHESVKMVDSGTEFGDIPEGWGAKRIIDIVDIQKGLSYKSENLVDDGKIAFVNLKCFERGGGFRYDGVKRFEGDFKEKHVVRCGDIVVAVTDMTQNREIVARAARIPKLNENIIIISMDVVKMNPKNGLDKSWLFGLLNYSSFGIKMKEFANGVNVLHLKSEPIGEYQFIMPDQNTIDAYSQIVLRIYQEIDNLQLKNQNLAATRDILLPKLISGALDVSHLDIKTRDEKK